MSLLWEQRANDTDYSVRQHGASIRLYSNGVFHSQWNPDRPFAGGIWDCLSLPTLYRPPQSSKRVLLLGVGGGAVIRQLERLIGFDELDAVDIDPIHLEISRRWFGVVDQRVSLIEADAARYLRQLAGVLPDAYDVIIDDLFGHAEYEPRRSIGLSDHWLQSLTRLLTPGGLLILNCIDARELKRAAPSVIDAGLAHVHRWSLPAYENSVGVASAEPLHGRVWSRHLDESGLTAEQRRAARRVIRRPMRQRIESVNGGNTRRIALRN